MSLSKTVGFRWKNLFESEFEVFELNLKRETSLLLLNLLLDEHNSSNLRKQSNPCSLIA